MASLDKGLFITLEGGEGTGKTTQIQNLSEALGQQGYEVVLTREPGGTPEAEKIRSLLVERDGGDWTSMAEVLLFFAARNMHVEKLIKPALAEGKIVICDRFTDSTRAYQAYGHGLDIKLIEDAKTLSIGDFEPDMTFVLDLPVAQGLTRAGKRMSEDGSSEDRFEQLDISFHEKLREGFLDIAAKNSARCHVIDAGQSVENIAESILALVLDKLKTV